MTFFQILPTETGPPMRESMGEPRTPPESRLALRPPPARHLNTHQPPPGQAGFRRGAGFPYTPTHRQPDQGGWFLKKGPRTVKSAWG